MHPWCVEGFFIDLFNRYDRFNLMSIEFAAAVATLAQKGVVVNEFCTIHGALGHVSRQEMNTIYNCSAGENKITTLTHEGIHLLQYRLGVEAVDKMLEHCSGEVEHYAGIRASKWEDPYEQTAYRYEGTACAQKVVLETLDAYTPPPPPAPKAPQGVIPLGTFLALLFMVLALAPCLAISAAKATK